MSDESCGKTDTSTSQRGEIRELASHLKFMPETGRILLENQSMLLLHATALSSLRKQLVETFGMEHARTIFTRMGFAAGTQDAYLIDTLLPNSSLLEKISNGPRLHSLQGVVSAEMVRLEGNLEAGEFLAEFIWHNAIEDEIHLKHFGVGTEPVSWMQIGYASAYISALLQTPVLFRELECRGMGHQHCRAVAKPVTEWVNIEADLRYFPEDFAPHRPASCVMGKSFNRSLPNLLKDVVQGNNGKHPIGASAAFNVTLHMMEKVAETDATVLFHGESGVGKEMLARTLHKTSLRANQSFIAVNCAAIPEQLIESELFGVEKGAYTGATESRAGRFERAHGGTLFLDEVACLTPSAQGKLLRALQEGEIERVGDRMTRRVDVRVIAACNINLREAAEAGEFREDLFFRLNVFPIHIPPLRERKDDILLLVRYFLERFAERYHKTIGDLTPRAIEGLLNYEWPGNIRELENILERGVILAPEDAEIDLCHLFTSGEKIDSWVLELSNEGEETAGYHPASAHDTAGLDTLIEQALDGQATLDQIETRTMETAIQRSNGNLSAAARLLGITRGQLAYRMSKRE